MKRKFESDDDDDDDDDVFITPQVPPPATKKRHLRVTSDSVLNLGKENEEVYEATSDDNETSLRQNLQKKQVHEKLYHKLGPLSQKYLDAFLSSKRND